MCVCARLGINNINNKNKQKVKYIKLQKFTIDLARIQKHTHKHIFTH